MPISAGSRLGPYQVLDLLGSGGMGEVYRASDSRLGRDVAVKVLPSAFAADPERLRRFEQEARATAALSHPNILALYDVGTFGGCPYVVSELLNGRTLRDESESGPLPARKALAYALQIARGLAAAHERGIVHRDLKPENVFVTREGQIKILDFGLAKLTEAVPDATGTAVVTAASPNTQAGVLLGTLGYMSPEHVRGVACDQRSDIFSLGAMLYELLTGQRAFQRATPADTMTAILKEELEPPAGPGVSPGVARIVMRCLEKVRERRFQSASDLAFALEALAAESGSPVANITEGVIPRRSWTRREIVFGASAALLTAALIVTLIARGRPHSPSAESGEAIQFSLRAPEGTLFSGGANQNVTSIDISPDGKLLAFVAQDATGAAVWLRPLDSSEARPLKGTEGALGRTFWSTDSQSIGFFAAGQLKRIDVATLAVRTITDVPVASGSASVDGTWNAEDVILFSRPGQPLVRVSAEGGQRTAATSLDDGRQEISHQQPQFLPDGHRFLYVVQSANPVHAGIYLGSLDEATTKQRIASVVSPFAFASPGYLLFLRDRSLMAQRVDLARLDSIGQVQLIGEVSNRPAANPLAAVIATSRTNVLAYSNLSSGNRGFFWVDRAGRELGPVGEPGEIGNFDLSLDETRLVFHAARENGPASIWEFDFRRGVTTQLTSTPSADSSPVWSQGGDRIAFSRRTEAGLTQIVELNSTNGQETVLLDGGGRSSQVDDWSPDGRYITFNRDPDLMALPLAGGRPFAFVETASSNVDESHFSPDGKWIAYNSNDRGVWQVYVAPFPPTGQRWQVSAAGGVEGRWRGDGRELYYLSPNGRMMAVEMDTSNGFQPGAPRELFDARVDINPRGDHYAVSKDGQQFLIRRQMDSGSRDPWMVIVNWQRLLER